MCGITYLADNTGLQHMVKKNQSQKSIDIQFTTCTKHGYYSRKAERNVKNIVDETDLGDTVM